MSTSINNSGITFPDSTTQTSAAIQNSNIPVLSVYYTSTTSISSGTYTTVPFNSVVIDTHSGWNSGGNYYTIPITGYYQINAATGVSYYYLMAALTRLMTSSGQSYQGGQLNGYIFYGYNLGAAQNFSGNVDTVYYLTAGTTVYVQALGISYNGAAVTNYGNWLQLYYIRS
jgi:hypothetical protein